MYTFTKDDIIIRTMKLLDVSSYVGQFGYQKPRQLETIKLCKNILKSADESAMFFTVLQNGKVIGAVTCRGTVESITTGMIEVDIPANRELEEKVKGIFFEMLKEYWFYDDVFFITTVNGMKVRSKNIVISGEGAAEGLYN